MHCGEEKFDVGLCVKNGPKGLCVPDYVRSTENGWAYSDALVQLVDKYKVSFLLLVSCS